MPYCGKCGTQHDDGAKFCTSCGNGLAGNSRANNEKTSQQQGGPDFSQAFSNINNTADYSSEYDRIDIDQNKGMAVLSYIGLLVLVPIFAAKESRFARFHVNQGLVFMIISFITWVVTSVINTIFVLINLGLLAWVINFPISVSLLALMIIGIVNAATGKAKELPLIGKITIFK